MDEEQRQALEADMKGLPEGEIRKRLARGDYRTDRAKFVELYLPNERTSGMPASRRKTGTFSNGFWRLRWAL
jgi:hypothetical protein